MTYKPGQSGNVKGRPPKGLTVAEYIGSKTQQGRLLVRKTLELALNAESESVRLSALQELQNRYWGKPAQTVTIEGETPASRAIDAMVRLAELANQGVIIEGQTAPMLAAPDAINEDTDATP